VHGKGNNKKALEIRGRRVYLKMCRNRELKDKKPCGMEDGNEKGFIQRESTVITLSLTAHLMLLISLQSYKLAPPKKTTMQTEDDSDDVMGADLYLPYLLCRYSSILLVPVFSCLTCGPKAEAP
jgi:hypothetical protein